MRSSCQIPAIALKSVAARYGKRQSLDTVSLASRHRYLGAAVNASRSAPLADTIAAKMRRTEAVLFVAREPLSSRKLSQYANLADGTEARTLVRRLNQRLDAANRAFRVQEVAGGFQLTTRPKFAKWLRRLDHVPSRDRLSTPSMETLAVVAFRQPVIRAEIEAIRGVSCGEILQQLMSRDLIRVGGRSEGLGRPYLYNTTKRFLQLFGLRSLDDLPKSDRFRTAPVRLPPEVDTSLELDDRERPTTGSMVEEESDVSVSVEQENHPQALPTKVESDRSIARPVRSEHEDFDVDEFEEELDDLDEYDDDEDEDDEEDEEELEVDDDEEDEEDDEDEEDEEDDEDEYEEVDDDDLEDDEYEDEEEEDEDEEEEDFEQELDDDLDEYEEEDEEEEEDEVAEFEDDEWEEVEEEDEDDWDDDDWEDDDEWDEDEED